MHQPVWEGIEAYLAGKPEPAFLTHIAACAVCREAVADMELQSQLIRALRAPADVEPGPGFYGRVLDRIDTQKSSSIWNVFLEPLFARRLMYASAVLTLLLGVALFTSPKDDAMSAGMEPERILAVPPPEPVRQIDPAEDRNTVFMQFVSYQE